MTNNLQQVQYEQVKAESIGVGDIISICGYWYSVLQTHAENFTYGVRQASKCKWAGIGEVPYQYYQEMDHGKRHGLTETVLILDGADQLHRGKPQ